MLIVVTDGAVATTRWRLYAAPANRRHRRACRVVAQAKDPY